MNEPPSDERIPIFIENLTQLDAGGKARLKRSAGRSLDEANRNLALFYSLLPRPGVPVNQEPTYWLVATLYPLADAAATGTFGAALHRARATANAKGLDRRVEALLDSDSAQLAYRLGQAIRFLHSNRVPVNWQGLLEDLLQWEHPSRFVQKKWAKDYFGTTTRPTSASTAQDIVTQETN